jgi:hypothetical protein
MIDLFHKNSTKVPVTPKGGKKNRGLAKQSK